MKAFVVRVWTPSEEVEAPVHAEAELRGLVEAIGASEAAPFRNEAELLRILRERLSEPVGAREQGGARG